MIEILPFYNQILIALIDIFGLWLAVMMWRNNPKGKINRIFLGKIFFMALWVNFAYMARVFGKANPDLGMLFLRIAWFATPPLFVLLYFFVVAYLEQEKKYRVWSWIILVLGVIATFLSGFSSFIIKGIRFVESQLTITYGSGMIPFLAVIFLFMVSPLYLLIKAYVKCPKEEKIKIEYLLVGISIFYLANGIFNISFPLILKIYRLYWIGDYSSIILLGFTFYAIVKRELFGIKVVLTTILVGLIGLLLLMDVMIFTENLYYQLIRTGILIVFIFFGISLIKGVNREIKYREDINRAYESEKKAKNQIDAIRIEDEALLGSIGDGVVAIDNFGKIMFINRAAEEMLRLKGKNPTGKPHDEILRIETEKGEAVLKEKNPLNIALSSGKKIITSTTEGSHGTIYSYVRSDNTKFPAAIIVTPVIINGQITGAVDVFRDMTVERQIDKSKSEFVSLASHQLRTPLTAIKWYAEILLAGKAGKISSKQKEYVEQIYRGNERMIKLINIMLNISRLEAGRLKIALVPTDIKKLIEDIIIEQEVNIKKRKQKLKFECDDNIGEISVDPDLVRLIFQNIISNAVKYTPEKGSVGVKINKNEKELLFEISDTGIGIPENQQNRIFQKLFRAENAFPHTPDGNGLGLYAAKMTTESMGGKIWFKSKINEGTTFFVVLPIK